MAKAPSSTQPQTPSEVLAEEVFEQVTYLPGPEDPPSVKWGGHTFFANVPKIVPDSEMIEKARGNKFFKVGEFKPGDEVPTVETALPKTPEQYRAHVAGWLKTVQSAQALAQQWQDEESLRMACGVGTDDLELLRDIIAPVMAELKKRGLPN